MFFGEGFGHDAFPRKPVDNETFYKILGVSKSAGVDEIKKAFKKLAIKHHPDKGGDQEKFKEVCKAYEVLSDPEKRGTYDKFGEEGLESMGNGGAQATDIFDMFFGGGSRRPRGPKRGEDVVSELKWSLEQFYNGATRRMAITHDVICSNCDGHGGPADAMVTCEGCHGTVSSRSLCIFLPGNSSGGAKYGSNVHKVTDALSVLQCPRKIHAGVQKVQRMRWSRSY